jgi:hypothetical protein
MRGAEKNCPKCIEAARIIKEWSDKQGHDRCWYYPDLFTKLASLFKLSLKVKPSLPPRHEFEEGCKRYQDEEYS